tara:strand:+ start:41 stop:595 length:555 start_codon:yes stop_codon:yes gene_type:complete
MANPMYGQNKADKEIDAVSSVAGVVVPSITKTPVGAGAFPDLAVNNHYVVTGTITATTKTLPAGSFGDVIYIEMVSETAAALMVTNAATLIFKTPGATFEYGSSVKWFANAASNGAAQLTKAIDCTAALAVNDNTLTLTGATAGGPGNGSWLCFTKGESFWRLEGHVYGAGACTAVVNAAIANT